jgi:D-hydroxyproline dehydrogenase subunit beta
VAVATATDRSRYPHRMQDRAAPSPDVVVVGGGIVGCATACFLAKAGARVVVVEREGLASGASGANSGIVQHPFDPVLAELYRATVDLYRVLTLESRGFPFGPDPAGMLFISLDPAVVRKEQREIAAAFPSIRTELLSGAELQRLEPAVGPELSACHAEIGYPVMPGSSTYAYATLAEERGAQIRQGRAAVLEMDGETAVGVRIDGRLLPAGAVLAAAGPWTPELLDPTGRWRPIRPTWGVVVEAEVADPPRHILEEAGIEATIGVPAGVRDAAGAVAPAVDAVDFSLVPLPGASAVGSTFLHHEPDPAAWVEPILVRASRFVPAVADAPIRGVRACARPQCEDGRPLIGAVPGRQRLYVCAGHGPWGISTGPASGRLVADLILGREPLIAAELSPERFGAPG